MNMTNSYLITLHGWYLVPINMAIQIPAKLDMTDSMGPGKLICHMQNLFYTYGTYLTCMGLGPSISSVLDKSLLYSGPSYPSSPVFTKTCHMTQCYSLGFSAERKPCF